MLGDNKNLKDISKDSIKDSGQKSLTSFGGGVSSLTYTRTNKLITALYMITDTMEKEEPIRLKLRTLGVEILSDINTSSKAILSKTEGKINEVLSFMNIAVDIRMISEMNFNILKKEFLDLKQSIQEFVKSDNLWLEEFIKKDSPLEGWLKAGVDNLTPPPPKGYSSRGEENSKGRPIRIGVQKGSTLLKALSNVGHKENHEVLKNKRREEIVSVIKNHPNGISIKDIMLAIRSLGEEWGEKTLQRELVSMVKDNVLKKNGEKRWSQYFLK